MLVEMLANMLARFAGDFTYEHENKSELQI